MNLFSLKKIVRPGLWAPVMFFMFCCSDDGLENPNYPAKPSIAFKSLKFIEVGGISDYDTLKLVITYKDGDSDLGLDPIDANDFNFPFHYEDYFLEDGTGDTIPVRAERVNNYSVISTPENSGLLVSSKTREKLNYNYLPAYDPQSCLNYSFPQVLVSLHSVDNSFSIQDTISVNGTDYALIHEPLLYHSNDNHYNIFVEFYVLENGNFERYDWLAEFCQTFDGRFPLIGDKPDGTFKSGMFKVNIKNPWEGKITYTMSSLAFLPLFGDKPLKLAITIKDRALHTSNTIVTPEFTLAGIK